MTFSHAMQLVDSEIDMDADLGIVLHYDDWHPRVLSELLRHVLLKNFIARQ